MYQYKSEQERPVWTFLDHTQSTISIITTVIYCLRVKPPYFYVYSYLVQMLILMLHLFKHYHLSIYTLIVCSSIASVIKWYTIFRYLKFYKILCASVVLCGIASTVCFFTAVNADDNVYIPYHSMWHLSIFMTAGFGSLLRLKLPNNPEDIPNILELTLLFIFILREANLINLLNELKKRKFKNHDYNFNDVKMNPKKIFWITEVSNLKIQTHH